MMSANFLVFETFTTAIPPYDRLRPYEQVPFQYSLYIVDTPRSHGRHLSYLSDGRTDPRLEILAGLETQLGDKGSVVAS